MKAAEACAEARRALQDALQARREIKARQSQIDNIAAQLAAHLAWIQQNPDAVWNLLRRQPRNQPTQRGNNP